MVTQEQYNELLSISRWHQKIKFSKLLFDMTIMEFATVWGLTEYEMASGGLHMTVNELASEIGTSVQQVSRMLRNLEGRNIVRRITDENCRRNTFVIVSENGRRLYERNKKSVDNYMKKVLESFTDEEVSEIVRLQKKLGSVCAVELEKIISTEG